MIRGIVNDWQEAIIRLRLRGTDGTELEIDAIVDTGFNASLTLPLSVVTSLALVRRMGGSALLADGLTRSFDIYAVLVEWDGTLRETLVYELGEEPLIGMQLFCIN